MQEPQECLVRYYLVDPRQIHYLRFIIEAYPGMAVVSTVDSTLGLVSITIAPGCEPDVLRILEAEGKNLKISGQWPVVSDKQKVVSED